MTRHVALIALLVASAAASADVGSTEVPVARGAHLVFVHPPGWQAKISGPAEAPTLHLGPGGVGEFSILVTAIPRLNGRPSSDKELAESVRRKGVALLSTAVQSEVTLTRVEGKEASGYLYHLTDRDPERGPSDFRELHQGAVVVGPYLLSVTILTHPGDSAAVADASKALASVTYRPEQQ